MLVEDETEDPRPAPENNRGKGFGVSRVPLRSSHKEFVDIDFLGYDIIHRHITGMNTSKHVSPRMAFYLVSPVHKCFSMPRFQSHVFRPRANCWESHQ